MDKKEEKGRVVLWSNATAPRKGVIDLASFSKSIMEPRDIAFDQETKRCFLPFNSSILILDQPNTSQLINPFDVNQKKIQKNITGVTCQPITNNLLACVPSQDSVLVIDTIDQPGKIVATIGEGQGYSNRYINRPNAVSCFDDGGFVVAQTASSRNYMQAFDNSGRLLHSFVSYDPEHFDPNLDYDDDFSNGVCVLGPRFCPSSSQGSSIVVAADVHMDVVVAWSKDGTKILARVLFEHARDRNFGAICADLKGFVYLASNNGTILVLDPRKNFATIHTIKFRTIFNNSKLEQQSSLPLGMCVDETNTLMVTDCCYNIIYLFDLNSIK